MNDSKSYRQLFENWRKTINELNRNNIDAKAAQDGGSSSRPTPFIGHNYRTRQEIEDGTIQLIDISDDGIMTWTIEPFDKRRKARHGHYRLHVKFVNWIPILKSNLEPKDKVLALIKNSGGQSDDLKIHCTCPSFKYHYNNVAMKQGVAIQKPSQAPGMGKTGRLANPDEKGIVCKHGRRIVQVFPAYYSELYSKIVQILSNDEKNKIEIPNNIEEL